VTSWKIRVDEAALMPAFPSFFGFPLQIIISLLLYNQLQLPMRCGKSLTRHHITTSSVLNNWCFLYAMMYCHMKHLVVLQQSNNLLFIHLFIQQTTFATKIGLPRNKIV
jgi:hypothetical protein